MEALIPWVIAVTLRQAAMSPDAPPPASPAAHGEVVERADAPARTNQIGVRVDAGFAVGTLPHVGAILGGSVSWIGRRLRIEAVVRGQLPKDSRATADPDVGGRLSLWAIGPRVCGVPTILAGRISFPLCGGLEVGQVLGRGFGFAGASRTRIPWGALLFAPGFAVLASRRLAFLLSAEAGLALNRADIVIENLETLHRFGFGFIRGVVGVEVRL